MQGELLFKGDLELVFGFDLLPKSTQSKETD